MSNILTLPEITHRKQVAKRDAGISVFRYMVVEGQDIFDSEPSFDEYGAAYWRPKMNVLQKTTTHSTN